MKKTLIALAAVAVSSAAFAQVTISGNLDVNAMSSGSTETRAAANTAAFVKVDSSATATHNTWATSTIGFTATEDLGGGLKATAVMISGVGDGFAARERTLALDGGFGSIRLGRFAPAASTGFQGISQACSANLIGSAYGMTQATAGMTSFAAGNMERNDGVIQYTTPSFSGLTATVHYISNKSDSNDAALTGNADTTQTGFNLTYAQGPLTVGAGQTDREVNREGAAAVTGVAGTASVAAVQFVPVVTSRSIDGKLTYIGASYNLGVATVGVTHITRKDETTNNLGAVTVNQDADITTFGLTAPLGKITLRAFMYTGDDNGAAGNTDDLTLKGHQISAVYALSKRTSAYAAVGQQSFKRNGAASTAAERDESRTTVGLRHTF